jgi:hypothetical protein
MFILELAIKKKWKNMQLCKYLLYVHVEGIIYQRQADPLSCLHCKKGYWVFPAPAEMSLTKLFLAGNN